jgi:hypothetical protein
MSGVLDFKKAIGKIICTDSGILVYNINIRFILRPYPESSGWYKFNTREKGG